MKRRSSLRTTLAPMPSTPIAFLPVGPHHLRVNLEVRRSQPVFEFESSDLADQELFRRYRDIHAAGGVENRFDDIVVAGAAADIALKLVPDSVLVELAAIPVDDIDRRHDHARRAKTALQSVIVAERGLHRMQYVPLRDTLDSGGIGAVGLSDQHRAGFDRPAIDMHDTGAALAGIAADRGAVQFKVSA